MCTDENSAILNSREEDACSSATDTATPDFNQIPTVLGESITPIGKQDLSKPMLISYGKSKVQGNFLCIPDLEAPSILPEKIDLLYDRDFLADADGNEEESIVLPLDAVDWDAGLNQHVKGIVVDCDLRNYVNGFTCLLDEEENVSKNIGNVLCVIRDILRSMQHFQNKGMDFTLLDGHSFYYNVEYGVFRFVYDGMDMISVTQNAAKTAIESNISSLILWMLTGAWSDYGRNELLAGARSEENHIAWDFDGDAICGSRKIQRIWSALPMCIRGALQQTCLSKDPQEMSFDDWKQTMELAMHEVDECAFCKHEIFKSASHCLCCGNVTSKERLLTSWLIQNASQAYYIKISFGRGTILPGEILGITWKSSPLMKMMYHSKSNSLGLKNMSQISWSVDVDGMVQDILPGKILAIQKNTEIRFEGLFDVTMQFLGYEVI